MKLCNLLQTLAAGSVLFCYNHAGAEGLPEPADIIIFNTRVVTVDTNFSVAQAVAVRGNRIVAVGKDEDVKQFSGPKTRMIDGWQKTVIPGLYDSRVQSWQVALDTFSCTTPPLNSIADAQDFIRKQDGELPTNAWIELDNLYPTRVKENRLPTKAELDAASTNHPVYWNCGPLAVANSKALAMSKITGAITNPPGGEIVRDTKTHEPNGLLRNCSYLLKLPKPNYPSLDEQCDVLKQLYHLYNAQGITSIGEENSTPQAIDMFRKLSDSRDLTVRINCARTIDIGTNSDDDAKRLDAVANAPAGKQPYGPTGTGDDWVRIGPLRTVLDGDVVTGTAYLNTPWGIGPTYSITEPAFRGRISIDPLNPQLLPALFLEATRRGWQLGADCVGDAAVDAILNCYEKVQFKEDMRQRRFIISHSEFVSPDDWERCRNLGIVADVPPTALYTDGTSLFNTLGDKRLTTFLPLKTWYDQGLVVGAGSGHTTGQDSLNTVSPWNPWLGIWTALTRQTEPGIPIHAEQCLTREQALKMYTFNNARINFEDKKKGSIETGKLADIVIINNDILNCPVDDIRNTRVLLTMVDGNVVYEAPN